MSQFGRACANLYLQCFGRRFRYKYNGKKDKRKRLPPAGSLKAVQAKRNSAADKLHRGADRYVCQLSFVENNQLLLPGQMLECMLAPDGPPKAPQAAAISKFERRTLRKRESNLHEDVIFKSIGACSDSRHPFFVIANLAFWCWC